MASDASEAEASVQMWRASAVWIGGRVVPGGGIGSLPGHVILVES